MDVTEDDVRYPPNSSEDNQQVYNPPNQEKLPACNPPFRRGIVEQYGSEEEEEEPSMDECLGVNDVDDNNPNIGKRHAEKDVVDNVEDTDEEFDDDDDDDDEKTGVGSADLVRHPKKRKLKSLASSYEFAPRVPLPSAALVPVSKHFPGGRNPLTDWTEQETFALLDAWGDKFLERGRKSLRSDEWLEVAEKVSEVSKIERTDTQCKNRLDTVKKKYKKEKGKIVVGSRGSSTSSWVYFKKMDMLMSTSAQQQQQGGGLSCGLDSGEYVFMNPKVYLNRANGFDEMRDSPGNSESADVDDDDDDDNSEGLPPKKRWSRTRDQNEEGSSSFHLLADSIERFSEIYEKIETSKREQMVELEKMRMNFHRDLEMQKREIMERAQSEIAKIRASGHDEQDIPAEDASA